MNKTGQKKNRKNRTQSWQNIHKNYLIWTQTGLKLNYIQTETGLNLSQSWTNNGPTVLTKSGQELERELVQKSGLKLELIKANIQI